MKNGNEHEQDCGGDCVGCPAGTACTLPTHCASRQCTAGSCTSLASCKAILAADATALSGIYEIDPDGAGALTPFLVQCDMASQGGGWTLVAVRAKDTATTVDATPPLTDTEAARAVSKERWTALRTGATESLATFLDGATPVALVAAKAVLEAANCTPLAADLTAGCLAHDETSGCTVTGSDYSTWLGVCAPGGALRTTYLGRQSASPFWPSGPGVRDWYEPARAAMWVR